MHSSYFRADAYRKRGINVAQSKKSTKQTAARKTTGKPRKAASVSRASKPSMNQELKQELIRWGVVLLLLILTLGIYLKDGMGIVGIGVNSLFVGLFGFSAYVITIYSMVIACLDLFGKLDKFIRKIWFGYAFMIILSAILHLANGKAFDTFRLMFSGASAKTGGLVGGLIGSGLAALIGSTGTMILLIFAMILLVVALTERSLVNLLTILGIKTKKGTEKVISYADEQVANAKLRAEERAAYKDQENQLKIEASGQVALAESTDKPQRKSSFFKSQKQHALTTDAASLLKAQQDAQAASLSGKTLSEIAQAKGVASSKEAKVPEEPLSQGATRMVAGAKEVLPDVKFEKPEGWDKEVTYDFSDAKKYPPSSYASPTITLPGGETPVAQPSQGEVKEPAYTEVTPQYYQTQPSQPVLDIPLIANDAYLEKKRRYLERTNRMAQQMAQEGMINEEDKRRQSIENAYAYHSEVTPAAEPAPVKTVASEMQPAAPVSVPYEVRTEEHDSKAETIVIPEVRDPNRPNAPVIDLFADVQTEKEKKNETPDSVPVQEDLSWNMLLEEADSEAEKQEKESGDIILSTEKLFDQEAFPTGYEDRRETAERIQQAPAKKVEKPIGPTGTYVFPPIDLLNKGKETDGGSGDESMEEAAAKLKQVMNDFGVEIEEQIQVNRGPAVTRFEIKPKTGVKVNRIVSLTDDIAMNLAAQSIRIEAPIPGKAAVGIEVPNKDIRTVTLREILESDTFIKAPSKVTFSLGRDIDNNPQVADVAKMPHMLIAGSTGSGKSVCINSLIVSLLYKADPNDVKLILIDPKVVELSVYNGIPHLLLPVVNDPKQASATLNWAVQEMTRRYKKFAEMNVRDVRGYNEMVLQHPEKELIKMPQIVIIIDELADLMMVASKEVETSICRLAQMARAAGMHLVIATQRPSVDVITGLIKANIPSRIAFAVSSGVDSRTILDGVGAEKLLGRGDMLFSPIGASKPVRIQGTFVSDHEVESVVEFVRAHAGAPVYDTSVLAGAAKTGEEDNGIGEEVDEFLEDAIRFVVEKQRASISMLQRAFRIGFNRAARLMDALEEQGVVGEDQGSKPRMVLMTKEEWENRNS